MEKSMRLNGWMMVATLLAPCGEVMADDALDELSRLKRQLQELTQRVQELEGKEEGTSARLKSLPTVVAGASGLTFTSPDTNFVLRMRGYLQADSRWYTDDQIKGNDTFLLRRVRPVFEGSVYQHYDYKVMLDFGAGTSSTGNNTGNNGMLQDAYINVHYWDEAQLMVGKFKGPVGLERLQSARNLTWVERGFPTQLIPNRDIGIDLHGNLLGNTLSYDLAALNGASDNGSDDIETSDDGKDIAARLFAQPFALTKIEPLKKLGLGVAGTIGNHEGTLRNYLTAGQQRFFAWRTGAGAAATPNVTGKGEQYRLVPQMYYYWGPFGMLAEYAISSQEVQAVAGATTKHARFQNSAWEVNASYVLTGEENSYEGVTPKRPLSWHGGGWGAVEIAGRIGQLSFDDALFRPIGAPVSGTWAAAGSAREGNEWAIGLNWYLNKSVKLNVDYNRTQFQGGSNAKGSVTAHDEQVILTRLQLAF